MGLYEKMFKVMEESESLDKSMDVGSGSYNYKAISEKEVLNKVKPLLKKYKLIVFPVDAEITQVAKITQIKALYKIVDVESGESELLATVGNGQDNGDKGSGKAWTYAYKGLFQKTFCLFSGEDTDNTHSNDLDKPAKVTVAMLSDVIGKLGKTEQEYIEWYNGREETKKEISELKFMPQETKQHLYGVLIKKVK